MATEKYDPSRLPVFTRGAQTPEEQDAMLHSGNPAAMSLQQWGRAASNQAASRSKMKNRGDTTFYSGYGEDRFRLSTALRAPDAESFVSDGGQEAPDANFDRMAPYLSKDAAGRELSARYGEAVKAEVQRQKDVKSTFDPLQYSSIEDAQKALSDGSATAVKGFSRRVSATLLTPEDRATIQANSMAKKLTEESAKYTLEGSAAPVFQAGPGGKLQVINEDQLSESARKRARAELERSKPAGWRVVGQSTPDGRIAYQTIPPADGGASTVAERNRQETQRAITGKTFRPADAASKTNVFVKAGDVAARFGIVGEAPDGKVVIDRTEVDASLVGALAQKAREVMMNGDETDNVDALARAIELLADERGLTADKLAKQMGGNPNAFEDTLSVANDELFRLLEVDSQQREAEAADAAQAYKDGFKSQLEGPVAGELIASRIVALRGSALSGNPYSKNADENIAEAKSTPALAATLAESFKAFGTNNGRFEDATTAALVRELEMVASGDPGADQALVKALDASRMQFTKWGKARVEAVREKAAGNPFLQQQVQDGAMVHDEASGFFMPPSLASQVASISDTGVRNSVLSAMPKDSTGRIVGYTVGNPDIVGGKVTNPAFNVEEANAQLRKSSVMAQGAASLDGLATLKWPDMMGNQIEAPFTVDTVGVLKVAVGSDQALMMEKGEDKGFSFEKSALPTAVKEALMKDPKLMGLYASGKPEAMSAAAAGAAADAYRTMHLSVASEVRRAYSGLVVFSEQVGAITPGEAGVLFGDASNTGGFGAGSSLTALNAIERGLQRLQKEDPEAFQRAKNEWDYYSTMTDILQGGFSTSLGDPRAVMGHALGAAKSANAQLRKQLKSNAYGVDNASADRILGAKDSIDKMFGMNEREPIADDSQYTIR